ncbi:hypothetical protein VTJ83DRAFT_6241 [Remersonia thermophila]|uniref:Mitochondrial escape protein 2 n=1 Tax=Remersonia thermophila TaxID=72144 RepID=A0ABR4D446_9PEZI
MIPRRALLRPAFRPLCASPLATTLATTLPVIRHRPPAVWACAHRSQRFARWKSTVEGVGSVNIASSETTGHIDTRPNESVLFLDNLFPVKVTSLLLWRSWDTSDLLRRFETASSRFLDPVRLIKRALPETLPIKVTEIIPRFKEGGVFVKFTYPRGVSLTEIEKDLIRSLEQNPITPWFNPFSNVKSGLIRGRPWLEDLYRLPKSRLRVEFVPAEASAPPSELSQESLYSIFRRYGKIADIVSQPPDSKVLPKYAYVDFVLVRDAIMARNCMHGFVLKEEGSKSPTRLRISYEQRVKPHVVWDWITNHTRIVIPIIAAFLAAFTVAVFDPIREFFVRVHVQKSLEFTDSKLYKWLKSQTSDILTFGKRKTQDAALNALFTQRKDLIDSLQNSLLETVGTFVVVYGPRGSGGRELVVDQVLQGRRDVVVIDCRQVVEARGEAGTIRKLANQVGYRPVFSWANNLSSMIDLAIQSTTGVKAGFSENFETQVVKILQTVGAALKDVALSGRKKADADANLTDDGYLESHPEQRPVVVIDNFMHKSDEKGIIYERISDWAAALVQSNIAHVIFVTTDASFSKPLTRALPDRLFNQVTLGDLSPEVAKQFVLSQLEADNSKEAKAKHKKTAPPPPVSEKQPRCDLSELDECIDVLGGRLTDLQVLARRLKVGQSPKRAVADIIDQSASEILRMYLLGNKCGALGNNGSSGSRSGGGDGEKKWSTEQAWYLVRFLATSRDQALRYNEVLLTNTFASSTSPSAANPEVALESLADSELISIKSARGRPATIRAGKPVYQAAFRRLVDDPVVRARMDLAMLGELVKIEAKTIEKAEAELAVLASLPSQPSQAAERIRYLLAKLEGSQRKIVGFEKEMSGLKKVLAEKV